MGFIINTFVFAAGFTAGRQIQQNYKIPRVDDPAALWQKLKEFVETYKKDK